MQAGKDHATVFIRGSVRHWTALTSDLKMNETNARCSMVPCHPNTMQIIHVCQMHGSKFDAHLLPSICPMLSDYLLPDSIENDFGCVVEI